MSTSTTSSAAFAAAMEKALQCKDQGNALLKAGEYSKASFQYHLVYMHIGQFVAKSDDGFASMAMQRQPQASDEQKDEVRKVLIASYNNLVLAKLNEGKLNRVLELCPKVLDIDPNNTKVRLRRCMAKIRLGDVDGAEEDLVYVEAHDPALLDGCPLRQELEDVKKAMAQKEKSLYAGKLFS
eukprot:PhM_4_TR17726/c0_g1_i1/m.63508